MNIFRLFLAIGFLASSASLFGMQQYEDPNTGMVYTVPGPRLLAPEPQRAYVPQIQRIIETDSVTQSAGPILQTQGIQATYTPNRCCLCSPCFAKVVALLCACICCQQQDQ